MPEFPKQVKLLPGFESVGFGGGEEGFWVDFFLTFFVDSPHLLL